MGEEVIELSEAEHGRFVRFPKMTSELRHLLKRHVQARVAPCVPILGLSNGGTTLTALDHTVQ